MVRCSSCDAEREPSEAPCAKCGAGASPELSLELDVRPRPAAVAKPPVEDRSEESIDLAFDPREREPSDMRRPAALARSGAADLAFAHADATEHDASDAWLLGDYGEPPKHWMLTPTYAWRAFQRRRAIRRALALRGEEAARATTGLEDSLVALAEQIRPVAEASAPYAGALDTLEHAERVLRSRDQVLLSEHDAQAARRAAIDTRLATLESELTAARAEGREAATALVSLQGVLAREESNLKRAESELRASQRRPPSGTRE